MDFHETKTKYSDRVTALLPMLYVAWSDAVLGPSEISLIHKKINELQFLNGQERDLIHSWTDPENAPDERVFHQWLVEIKLRAAHLDIDERIGLAELGLAIAKAGTDKTNFYEDPEVHKALKELERIFSLDLPDSGAKLLRQLFRENSDDVTVNEEVEYLQNLLDQPFPDLRDLLWRLMQDPSFRITDRPLKEDYRQFVLDSVKSIASYGYGAYAFPKKYGGYSDPGRHITTFEMLGYHDLSTAIKFGVQFGLFGGAVFGLGTEKHHEKYLREIGRGELLGCFAMTETGHGSNVKGLETTATYDPENGEFIIHTPHETAGKEYLGNALHGSMGVVFAQLFTQNKGYGVHAILVPLRNEKGELLPGIRVEDIGYKMGLNGVDNGRIWFDNVRVPRENLLDRFGQVDEKGGYHSKIKSDNKRFFTMLSTLVAGRIVVALASISASKVALTIAVKYGLKRRQFGPKESAPETLIMDYPSHQRRLFPLIAKTYAYHFALQDLAIDYSKGPDKNDQELESRAAGLKAMATWHATKVIQTARECCGGKGYLTENRLPALKADTDIFTTFEGDNTVLMQLVAKGLLSGFKKQFNDAGFFGIIRLLMSRLGTSLSELNPYVIRRTDREHLLDPEFHLNAFEYREGRLLFSVAQRMRKYLKQHISPYDAYLRCQDHLIKLSEAHLDTVTLSSFQHLLIREKGEEHKILRSIYEMYALDTIFTHRGWYLENDYISGAKSKAIRRLHDKLLRDLRPYANSMVDAFAITDESLAAEIV